MNTHEKNYTKSKLARRKAHVEEIIARYLTELEEAESAETGPATLRIELLTERLASLRGRLRKLEEIGRELQTAPDGQISLTDPDARAMATGSDHRGVVGYNVQAAVDTKQALASVIAFLLAEIFLGPCPNGRSCRVSVAEPDSPPHDDEQPSRSKKCNIC